MTSTSLSLSTIFYVDKELFYHLSSKLLGVG